MTIESMRFHAIALRMGLSCASFEAIVRRRTIGLTHSETILTPSLAPRKYGLLAPVISVSQVLAGDLLSSFAMILASLRLVAVRSARRTRPECSRALGRKPWPPARIIWMTTSWWPVCQTGYLRKVVEWTHERASVDRRPGEEGDRSGFGEKPVEGERLGAHRPPRMRFVEDGECPLMMEE